jgi:hypothetical protein
MTLLVLVLCLAVAAVLRLTALDLMVYRNDENNMIEMVSQVVDEGVVLTRGEPSTWGPTNPPLAVYLLAPAWAVAADPIAVAWWIALMNVAAVGVTFWIGQRYFSPRAGLIAAAFLAVSPWAVMFSRNIWRPDMMLLFVALLIAATLALVVEGRRRAIFWVCLWSGVVAQLYFPGYLAVAAVLVLLICYRPRVSRPALILGLVAVGMLYLPYGVYLLGGGWRGYFQIQWRETTPLIHQVDWMWNLVNLGNFSLLIAETSYYLDAKLGVLAFVVHPLAALERWVFVGGFVWLVWRVFSPRDEPRHVRPVGLLLILLIALPALICLVAAGLCQLRYSTVSFPAPFLVLGVAVDHGLARLRAKVSSAPRYRVASALVGLVLAGVIVTQVYFTTTLFSLLSTWGGAAGQYGIAYRHKVSLADHLAQTYGAGCFRLKRGLRPIYMLGVGSEMDDLVRRRAAPRPCSTPAPVPLYFLEVVNRPLSPAAEAALGPPRRFGPIFLYTKALRP